MGECYEYGLGVAVDLKKALECYLQAGELGEIKAFDRIAFFYEQGRG